MRRIDKIIIHCSATPEGKNYSVATIRKWHVEGRGWSDIGYHYIIDTLGDIYDGRPVEKMGAHTKGQNANSIGVCYIGGIDADGNPKDTRNKAQIHALKTIVKDLLTLYPNATIHGHNEFANKACPSFIVSEEF